MTVAEAQIIRKSDFAKMCGVSAARVSQWISEGKISGSALVGDGRGARINVGEAIAQLKLRLDVSQRFGLNGITTRLDAPDEHRGADTGAAQVSSVDMQIKALKLRQAELSTRREEENDRLARGVFVLASAGAAASDRVYTMLLEAIDGSWAEIADAFAAKYRIPSSEALDILRAHFNKIRTRSA